MARVQIEWGESVVLHGGRCVTSESLRGAAKNGQVSEPKGERRIDIGDDVVLPDGSVISSTVLSMLAA